MTSLFHDGVQKCQENMSPLNAPDVDKLDTIQQHVSGGNNNIYHHTIAQRYDDK